MRRIFTFKLGATFLALAVLSFGGALRAQIYVTQIGGPLIVEYSYDGTKESSSLVNNLGEPFGIDVSNGYLYTADYFRGTVVKSTTSGTGINYTFATPPGRAFDVAVSGSNLFVAYGGSGTPTGIAEYTTSGSVVNQTLVSPLDGTYGFTVAGSDIFVANITSGTVSEYTTSGVLVNSSLISGLSGPSDIVVVGSNLYVTNSATGTIGEYTTSGQTLNAQLVTGLNDPIGLAASGNYLYVSNQGNGTVGQYTLSGQTVNANLITGLTDNYFLAVEPQATPEPRSWILGAFALSGILIVGWRRRRDMTSVS